MFTKLIKYNLKPIIKNMLPFIILLLAAVIMMNITSYNRELGYVEIAGAMSYTTLDPPAITAFLNGLAQFLIYISLILLLATTVRANWRRFSNSFYSNEAYLTHTLPISRTMLWTSMFITVLISFLVVIATLILSGLLLVLSSSGQRFLDSLGLLGGCVNCFGEYYSLAPREISFYFGYAFMLFAELTFLTLCGITGIILGHRSSKNLTIVAGTFIYVLSSVLLVGIFYCLIQLDPEIGWLIDGVPLNTPDSSPALDYIFRALLYISLVYTAYSVALYFIDRKLLQHGINLD